jgi:hypothetical protein
MSVRFPLLLLPQQISHRFFWGIKFFLYRSFFFSPKPVSLLKTYIVSDNLLFTKIIAFKQYFSSLLFSIGSLRLTYGFLTKFNAMWGTPNKFFAKNLLAGFF